MCNWLQNNEINFKIKVLKSLSPTYEAFKAFLDFAIADLRLNFTESHLKLHDYESDHKVVNCKIKWTTCEACDEISGTIFLYKKTN